MAIGAGTLTSASGAVSDLFAMSADRTKAQGLRIKAQGDALEGQNYDMAAALAKQNAQFTEASTAIKEAQQQRESTMAIGGQRADVAGAGLAESGSAMYLLRDSASQAALTHQVLGQQGLMSEEGYQEQAQSFQNLSKAASFAVQGDNLAADAADTAATGAGITGILKGITAVASIGLAPFTGGASLAVGAALEGAADIGKGGD